MLKQNENKKGGWNDKTINEEKPKCNRTTTATNNHKKKNRIEKNMHSQKHRTHMNLFGYGFIWFRSFRSSDMRFTSFYLVINVNKRRRIQHEHKDVEKWKMYCVWNEIETLDTIVDIAFHHTHWKARVYRFNDFYHPDKLLSLQIDILLVRLYFRWPFLNCQIIFMMILILIFIELWFLKNLNEKKNKTRKFGKISLGIRLLKIEFNKWNTIRGILWTWCMYFFREILLIIMNKIYV